MQALVLNDDRDMQVKTAVALLKRGFQVVTADTVEHAMTYAELGLFDLLVMGERVQGRLSHSVALRLEQRNPGVTTMIQTPRTDADADELFELLPSLYGLLGSDLAPELVARMAVAGVTGMAHGAARAGEDGAEWNAAGDVDAPMVEDVDVDADEAGEAVTADDLFGDMLADIMARASASLSEEARSGYETAAFASRREAACAA